MGHHYRMRALVAALAVFVATALVLQGLAAFASEPGPSVASLDAHQPAAGRSFLSLFSYDPVPGTDVNRHGAVIMGKMTNSTVKAELGRSAWRLIHTMVGKFPHNPTAEQQKSLLDFIYLFSRLYPCGDCAAHFQKVLAQLPPDVSSREAATQWACKAHNIVNARLKKPIFDCSKVGDMWKCGCDEENAANVTSGVAAKSAAASTKQTPVALFKHAISIKSAKVSTVAKSAKPAKSDKPAAGKSSNTTSRISKKVQISRREK